MKEGCGLRRGGNDVDTDIGFVGIMLQGVSNTCDVLIVLSLGVINGFIVIFLPEKLRFVYEMLCSTLFNSAIELLKT